MCDHYVIFRNTCGGLILKRIGRQHVVSIDFITGAQPSVYGRFLIYRPLHSATFNMYKVEIFNVIGQISHYCVQALTAYEVTCNIDRHKNYLQFYFAIVSYMLFKEQRFLKLERLLFQ